METPKEYKRAYTNGVVNHKILSDVIYSFNKRAKNMRDKEFSYRELGRSSNYGDLFHNEERYREKKEQYYSKKEALLKYFSPVCIHTTAKRIEHTVADYEFDPDELEACSILEEYERYDRDINDFVDMYRISYIRRKFFLYYEIGEHSFHTPVEEIPKGNTLPVIELDSLETCGEDKENLLSVNFCNKVLDGLDSGKLTLVLN